MADAPKLLGTDTLRQAYPKINSAIDNANEAINKHAVTDTKADSAVATANNAVNTANEAKTQSQSVQEQFNQVVIEGDSSVEAAQARVAADGTSYTTLQGRLNASDAQLADIVTVNVKKYGAKGNGTTDDTQAIVSALSYAKNNLPCTVYFPKGTYLFTDIGDLAYEGLTIEGLSDKATILKCTSNVSNHNAITYNGFRFGTTSDQFVFRCNLKNIQVQGNENTANIFFLQGIAMANWENVVAAKAKSLDGKAYHLKSVMLSNFKNVSISANLNNITPLPYYGLYIDEGSRGGNLAGNSTNNTFTNCYFESVNTGIHIEKGDQNLFVSGAAEGCSNIGLIINTGNSRMNTFIGTGFEKNASGIEIIDNGRMTNFISCYAELTTELRGQMSKISGGLWGSVRITSTGTTNHIENIRVNFSGVNDGGFIDEGTDTIYSNVYDMFTGQYVKKSIVYENRSSITVGASPFKWKNTTGKYVNVIMQSGTCSSVSGFRNGSSYLLPPSAPSAYILAPNDEIQFVYSATPSLSYVPLNGLL